MKRTMISILILTVLGFWIPSASAEVSQDLDPMVSPESQATVTNESSANSVGNGPVSNTVSTAGTTTSEKKVGESKKKTKKSSAKKLSNEKSSKSSGNHSAQSSKKQTKVKHANRSRDGKVDPKGTKKEKKHKAGAPSAKAGTKEKKAVVDTSLETRNDDNKDGVTNVSKASGVMKGLKT